MKSPDHTPTEEDEGLGPGEWDEWVALLEPGDWCASDGKEDGSERAEIDVEIEMHQRGKEFVGFCAYGGA